MSVDKFIGMRFQRAIAIVFALRCSAEFTTTILPRVM